MSTEAIGHSLARAHQAARPVAIPVRGEQPGSDHECLEFVRFCYRRRRVSWPELYDEMAAVAARGAYRGMSFAELAERGITFSLPDLPRLAALTEQVTFEERTSPEPHADARAESRAEQPAGRLTMVPARG